MNTGLVDCIDKASLEKKTFYYNIENDGNCRIFRIYPENTLEGNFFEFSVEYLSFDTGRIKMMNNFSLPEFTSKGIPEAMIVESCKKLSLERIISSPAEVPGESIFRTCAATKVWEKLHRAGVATYDIDADVYTYTRKL